MPEPPPVPTDRRAAPSAPDVKRVLVVSYYFPPSGGPGVQRVLKFIKYLPACGWEPVVLTVRTADAAYPELDATLQADVPPGLRVERTRAWDPYALYARLLGTSRQASIGVGFTGEGRANRRQRAARWIRANLFRPDARVGWVPFARARAHRLLKEGGVDVVLTSGPPHSAHLVGKSLAADGIPWVADFRDPWTDISYYRELPFTRRSRRREAALERAVLDAADRVVTVSPALQALLGQKTRTPIVVIPNGFDPADFVRRPPPRRDVFRLTHTGTLSASQNPTSLWAVLGAMRREGALPALRLQLVGNVDPVVCESLEEAGLMPLTTMTPYVPHPEAVRYMCEASLLLLAINRVEGAEGIVTGKVFEYLASGRPVLGVGPPLGDAAKLLGETGAGRLFGYEDRVGMAAYLRSAYAAWEAGHPLPGADAVAARAYDRRVLTGTLAALLDALHRPAL